MNDNYSGVAMILFNQHDQGIYVQALRIQGRHLSLSRSVAVAVNVAVAVEVAMAVAFYQSQLSRARAWARE